MRILLTGASGFLGREVMSRLSLGHTVIPVGGRTVPAGGFCADLRLADVWTPILTTARPDALVHLAAYRDPDFCEENPTEARRLNTAPVAWLAAHLPTNIFLLFVSTDYVFSGDEPPYTEDSPRRPINTYGLTKMEAEDFLAGRPHTLVLRIPLLVGAGPTLHTSGLLLEIFRSIKDPSSQLADNVLRRFPTWIRDVADAIAFVIDRHITGTLHYSGPIGLTRFQMVHKAASVLGLSADHILPSERTVPRRARRPMDSQLDTTRIRALGYDRATPFEEIVSAFATAHLSRPG